MLKLYRRPNITITDLLEPANERSSKIHNDIVEMVHDKLDPRFTENMQKDFDGTGAKGSVKVVDEPSLPSNENIIGNRYVLCIKDTGT